MNELLWLGFALADLCAALVIFRIFGKEGLYGLIVVNLIVCNIQVIKVVELFGLTTTLGNILYAGVFLATDILSEFHGKEAAKRGVYLGFTALILSAAYMQVALWFKPAPDDFANPHLTAIFGFQLRIALASLAAYIVSQLHDVWAFHFWKRRTGEPRLWLRNNASTLVSQFLDSLIFCALAFAGMFPFMVWLEILATTYLFKTFVAILDTPFIYLARRMHRRSEALG